MHDAAVREEVQALDELLARVEDLPEAAARDTALTAIQGLLRVYGEALRRIVATTPPEALAALRADELVSQLLLLHDLHPATLEERIAAALQEVRPYLGSHGGGIELVSVTDGVAHVSLQGTCSGCAASTVTLKLAVEEAVLRAAPELRAVEAVEPHQQPRAALPANGLLPMYDPTAAESARAGWLAVEAVGELDRTRPLRRSVNGSELIFASVDGQLYAYVDHCPACRSAFDHPELSEGALRCAECGRRYDLRRAGVALDGGLLQLEPVPLLVKDGQVRVAVEAVAS